MTDLVAAIQGVDLAGLPDVSALPDERAQILWVLAAADKAGQPVLTPAEISLVLVERYKIAVSRQKVQAILSAERGTVVRKRRTGVRAYQVMKAGLDEVLGSASKSIMFVEPEQALSKIRETEEILAGLRGTLRVCDPYVDGRTLDLLAMCARAAAIRLLTVNVNKPNPFARDMVAFNKEHGDKLEVRVDAQKSLHDRYIIHRDGLLLLGGSLNGLGKKQTFIVALGHDLEKTVTAAYETRWSAAAAI